MGGQDSTVGQQGVIGWERYDDSVEGGSVGHLGYLKGFAMLLQWRQEP